MSEIVSKWILQRLGILIDMTPDTFAMKTSNGLLLAKMLRSYDIITTEQLNLISDSDHMKHCYENFKLINTWLTNIDLRVEEEDLYEIVHGVGSTSLHLFYQVFLELKDKTKLDFLTDNELNAQLNKRFHRFYVRKVDEREDLNKLDLHDDALCETFLAGGAVYHWYKDRIDSLQNRCRDARDEYIHNVKYRGKQYATDLGMRTPESGYVLARGLSLSPRPSKSNISVYNLPDEETSDLDIRTYDELVELQNEVKKLPPFSPDPNKAKRIIKKLHVKSKVRQENKILRNQVHQEIMNEFDKKINSNKANTDVQVITNIFLKQSLYEKELVTKLGQVKMQKEHMIQNKFKQGEILNKLKEKDFLEALLLKDKELTEKKLNYYLEHERVLQLHKKIWEERMKLRAKRHQELCSQAVKDLVDISLKISEYKKRFGREPNKREMQTFKNLFVSGQSPFNICDPVIQIINDSDEDMPDAIITREMSRQNALDQEEFDNYVHYEWPWELKNVNFSSEMFQQICYGINVLGYIVHRALDTKYPLVPLWEVPQFPEASVRVCINGLTDINVLPSLRNYLYERDIKVIELSQAVDYCIDAYRVESKREYDDADNIPIKEGKPKVNKPAKEKKGEKSNKKKKDKLGETAETMTTETMTQTSDKLVQTPIKYPCEEIPYTPAALLGKAAQELLDEGRPLGDFLLIDMFVEYLHSITNLKGWVLINYPSTFEQAAVLEEALKGVKLINPIPKPDMDKALEEIIEQEPSDEKDECSLYSDVEIKRASTLLPNPVIPEPVKIYDTVLTAYIGIKKMAYDDKRGEAVLPPSYEELGNEPDPLDRFYSNAGANYSMYYKEFDLPTIKYLAKLIIGDFSLPLKSSVELFGEMINLDYTPSRAMKATKKGEKLKKPAQRMPMDSSEKTSTKVVTGKKDKKGKTKIIIVFEDKGVQVPTEDEEDLEPSDLHVSLSGVPSAGQPGWEYCNLDCPEELLNIFATLWEAVEEIYINDLKQVFFLKRITLDSIMPFSQYVKDVMKKIINRPDYKGFYLAKFQKAFNAFDMDFRKDAEFKAEMHYRIEDFKEKLAEMCDIKMMESENFRCRIINADWTPRAVTELINTFINMLQIELDRFIESIRIINDYYLGIILGMPLEDDNYKEENIPKFREMNGEVINNMFQESSSTVDLSYFDELFSGIVQKVNSCSKRLCSLTNSSIEKTKALQTANLKSKSKASSPKSKGSKDVKKTIDLDTNLIRDNYDKLLEEWQCAVKGETLRISLRIDLIKFNALKSIEEFLTAIQTSFHEIYEKIRSTYWTEMENIKKVCSVFLWAVENEVQVQKELIFEGNQFFINPEVNLFDNPPIIPDLPTEVVDKGAFTIAQLSKLADILLDLSPTGYMPRTTFMFILQDLIWVNPVEGDNWLAPKLWKKLTYQGLKEVIDALFDDLEYVYWRDFIIYNIRVNYPTERELLLTRRALRACDPDGTELVQDYQFFSTKLWFEYVVKQEDVSRIQDIKRLLFKLYKIKNYGLNYTAMLLDFCKDTSLVEGFAKALELSVGKIICWDSEIGTIFQDELIRRMKEHEKNVTQRDAEREENYNVVYQEVSKLVDHVVHINEDLIIEDLDQIKENVDNNSLVKGSILKKSSGDEEAPKRISKGEEIRFSDTLEHAPKIDSEESVESPSFIMQKEDSQLVKLYRDLPDNVLTESNDVTEIIFFLSLDVLITVITAALPWHSRVQNYGDLSYWEAAAKVFEECRNPDFAMSVLSHEFLNSRGFLELLSMSKKFREIDPVRVVYDNLECIEKDSDKTL